MTLPFKVLILTSQAPGHFSMRCMQAGAAGYVCKQQDLTELLSAIKAVLSGYSYFPNQALHTVRSSMGNASEADMVDRLSGREMMVLQQLARGKTNKEIADGMFLSNKTVSTYKTRLLLKLNAHSLVDLIELAQRNGLVLISIPPACKPVLVVYWLMSAAHPWGRCPGFSRLRPRWLDAGHSGASKIIYRSRNQPAVSAGDALPACYQWCGVC